MKLFKRLFLWIMISIAIQLGGLFYANNYLFATNTKIKAKKIEDKKPVQKEKEVSIPETAQHINLSFNAKYLAYYDNDILKVTNLKTGEEKKVEFNEGVKVSFYKWLPDRNRMLIAEKHSTGDGNKFILAFYDLDKNLKEEIKELTWADKKAEVEDIQASPLTNVIFVKVAQSGKRSSIYWINIMKEMRKVETRSYVIGTVSVIPHEDRLVYEDLLYNKIYMTKSQEPISISGVTKPRLLAVDNEDKIYIGATKDDKVTKIYFGSFGEGKNSLSEVDLKEGYDKKDIFITGNGKILINKNLEGKVKEVGSGKEYVYPGKFIQVYDGGVASVSDGKLVKTPFN